MGDGIWQKRTQLPQSREPASFEMRRKRPQTVARGAASA